MVATAPLAPPIAELILEFVSPRLHMLDDKPHAAGTLTLKYKPAGGGRGIDGMPTDFISPLNSNNAEDLRWYIEDYCRWPWGVFRNRALSIEAKIPQWGRKLYDAIATSPRNARAIAEFTRNKAPDGSRIDKRITIYVDHRDTENNDAAALLFGLPWELLHDEDSYLFDGAVKARVRRTLPSDTVREQVQPRPRVRVLLVRARPEDDQAKFIDPRSSALPLVETLHELGDQVKLDILSDGTFDALQNALTHAEDERDPYQVVHFDGHGVYDKVRGLGLLCFEDAEDVRLGRERRRSHNVPAKDIGSLLRDRRVSLFVLDACQSAMAETNVDTSVAAELLRQGVVSVVAMRYAVLLSTAKRFVEALYGALAKGHRIGRAMVEAQYALKSAPVRSDFGSKGRLELQDWMVPVLFQEGDDPQIFVGGVATNPEAVEARKQDDTFRRGELHAKPLHGFVGRARDLLRIERRISRTRRVAIVGAGGEGKTALAVEAAHWFLLTKQRERVAFVSVERLSDARAVLDAIGRQLVPGYSVAMVEAGGSDPIHPVKSALLKERTLLIVDNFESLFALADKDPTNAEAVRDIVKLVHELADVPGTWLITTSRESLPAPLDGEDLRIGSLDLPDARELLVNVLREKGIEPPYERKAAEELEQAITSLIEAVRGHARSLVLLGPNIAGRGIEPTREAILCEMVALEKRFPGDREKSLLASVRVSLDRLDPATRKKIAPLCVFRQAAHYLAMAVVLQIEPNDAMELSNHLVDLGLVDADGAYLLPDPALREVLEVEMDALARISAEKRWCNGMYQLARFLYRQRSSGAPTAVHATRMSMLDLVEALEAAASGTRTNDVAIEVAMRFASELEALISTIGHPRALTRVRAIRKALTRMTPDWTHARFAAESEEVDRHLEAGNIRGALEVAILLRNHAEAMGDRYPQAEYDRAIAQWRLGHVLKGAGSPEQALDLLVDARSRFAALALGGDDSASSMEFVIIAEQGDALRDLGRLETAATAYNEAIRGFESIGDARSAAGARGQLGSVYLLLGRSQDALDSYHNSLRQFEALGEPAAIAMSWHNIAMAYETGGQYSAAEHAYKESLRIKVRYCDRAGEAISLAQLGNLYSQHGRLDDAVSLYKQAALLFEELGDDAHHAQTLYNVGITLRMLGRFDDARNALNASLALYSRFGYTDLWKIWLNLFRVEQAAGQSGAAEIMRANTIRAYRSYRRAGGEAMGSNTRLVADVEQHLTQHGAEKARALVSEARASLGNQHEHALLFKALDALVAGDRDPTWVNDPALDPVVAAELQLLLETLSRTE